MAHDTSGPAASVPVDEAPALVRIRRGLPGARRAGVLVIVAAVLGVASELAGYLPGDWAHVSQLAAV